MSETPADRLVYPERLVAGGEAIAHASDGRVLFVRGGLPGETVQVATVSEKRDWSRVRVTDVVSPSPIRVVPPCPRRLQGCGGCDWQHVEVDAQLPAKAEVVRDALRRTARLPDAKVEIGGSVPDRGYRTTIRVVGDEDGLPAFRKEGSHATVEASGCLVAHAAIEDLLGRVKLTPGLELTLRTSVATGELSTFWDEGAGTVDGLPQSAGTGRNSVVHEQVLGHRFRVSARSFFQSGPAAAELLVASVKRLAPELASAETLVDLYSGVGLFGVAASAPPCRVVAVEGSKSAVADCVENLRMRDARVLRARVEKWRPDSDLEAEVVIADPSRSGLGEGGVETVDALGAPVLALVSCDPAAMARDVRLLGAVGYRHEMTEVHDVFPHTHHVECVTRLIRG